MIYVDGFGNVALNVGHDDLASTFLRLGHRILVQTQSAQVTGQGQGLLYEDSARALALAVNRESAAEMLGLSADDEVTLSPAS